MRLMLWSAPRGRSTAFFRMMAERGDFTVVHEPFSYLGEFGHTDVGGRRVESAAELLTALRNFPGPVFAKETTGHRYPEVLAAPEFLAASPRERQPPEGGRCVIHCLPMAVNASSTREDGC